MSETEQNQKWECTKKYNYNNFDFSFEYLLFEDEILYILAMTFLLCLKLRYLSTRNAFQKVRNSRDV